LRAGHLRTHPQTELAGRLVSDVYAVGKHLLVRFADGLLVRSHLGMYGSWHRYRPGEPWRKPSSRASMVLATDGCVLVCFNARAVELLRANGPGMRDWQRRLGPDLLAPDIRIEALPERARSLLDPQTPLADLLLDQRIASGIGNVYKSELLFLGRLRPHRPLVEVADDALVGLYAAARELIAANLGGGRRRTRFAAADAGRLWVYRRRGHPCYVCGSGILSGPLGRHARSTYWCPRCQA
jgi:endonuclease-8